MLHARQYLLDGLTDMMSRFDPAICARCVNFDRGATLWQTFQQAACLLGSRPFDVDNREVVKGHREAFETRHVWQDLGPE